MRYFKYLVIGIVLFFTGCGGIEPINDPPKFVDPEVDIVVPLGEIPIPAEWASGEDVEDGEIPCVFDISLIDFSTPGTYKAECTVTDADGDTDTGEVSVTVVDTTPPIVRKMDSHQNVFKINTPIDFESNILIIDNYDEELDIVIDDSTMIYDTPGVYDVTYTATDDAGNETELIVPYTLTRTIIPTFTEEITSDHSHIWIDYEVVDPDNTFLRLDVEVREEGELFYADSFFDVGFEIEIGGLPSDTGFTVTLTYTYDVGGKNGERERFRQDEILSDSWEIPELELDIIDVYSESALFQLEYEDIDGRLIEGQVLLYDGESGVYDSGTLLEALDIIGNHVIQYDALLTNHPYHIEMIYIYDLENGDGPIEVVIPLDIVTDEVPMPIPEILNTPNRIARITMEYVMLHQDYIVSSQIEVGIRLDVEGSPMIETQLFNVTEIPYVEFVLSENLLSDYIVTFTYEYDLRDGQGVQMHTFEYECTPYSVEIVNIIITGEPLSVGDNAGIMLDIYNLDMLMLTGLYIEELDFEFSITMMGPDIIEFDIFYNMLIEGANEFTIGYLVYTFGGEQIQIPLNYGNVFTIHVIGDPI